MGKNIIVVGLFVQLFFFGFFMIVTTVFHRRIHLRPTPRSRVVQVRWQHYLCVLYVVSVFITIRSIFRVAEYIQGTDGTLQSKEVYFYILDALLMFSVSLVFNIYHPSTVLPSSENMRDEDYYNLGN